MTKRNSGAHSKHFGAKLSVFAVLGMVGATLPHQAQANAPDAPMEEAWIYCRTHPTRAERLVTKPIRYRYPAGELARVMGEFEAKFEQLVGRDSDCEWMSVQGNKQYKDWDIPGSIQEVGSRNAPFSQKVSLIDLPKDWYPRAKVSGGPSGKSAKPDPRETQSPKQAQDQEPQQAKKIYDGPSPAEFAAQRHAEVAQRNRAAQEKYEAELAEQKRKVEEYEQAQAEVARKKAEQAAAAQAALAAHEAELAVAAEAQRKHEADLARYEQEVAAQKLRKDFDERNKLGQASTDTDANQCVTAPDTQLNASFQGNTAASVLNGCGKPVDVRICLMTDKGWNCSVTYGLGSQQRWSHSSFNATGQVFSDARTSGSSRALASPN